jgi:hypothetical protein
MQATDQRLGNDAAHALAPLSDDRTPGTADQARVGLFADIA